MAPRPPLGLPLFDWEPPSDPVARFGDAVRESSLRGKVCRSMKLAAEDSGKSREEIALAMADYLQEPVTKAGLDAAISEARDDHTINIVRFLAFIHATDDMRLLGLMAEQFDMIVVPAHYEHWVKAAQLREKRKGIERLEEAHIRLAKSRRPS